MRAFRFIRRQVRFILLGTRDVSSAVTRIDAEVGQIRGELAATRDDVKRLDLHISGLVALDAKVATLADHADNVTAHLRELTEESKRISDLSVHADNVTAHLRELTESCLVLNRSLTEAADRLTMVEESDVRHRREINAMRAGLRTVVDDLGDRVTQLTARLNEL